VSFVDKAYAANFFRGTHEEFVKEVQAIANRRSKEIKGWTYKTQPGKVLYYTTSSLKVSDKTVQELGLSDPTFFHVIDENRPTNVRSWTKNRSPS
jgi:hypothetical protein